MNETMYKLEEIEYTLMNEMIYKLEEVEYILLQDHYISVFSQ